MPGVAAVASRNGTVEVTASPGVDGAALLRELVSFLSVREFRSAEPTLEEIFVEAVRRCQNFDRDPGGGQARVPVARATPAFWITTVILPLLMAAWMILPQPIMSKSRGGLRLAVVDADRQGRRRCWSKRGRRAPAGEEGSEGRPRR